MQERVVIAVWEGHLEIGSWRYSGLSDGADTVAPANAESHKDAGG